MSSMATEESEESASRPRGRDAVVQAITEAAAELFAERGPAATSSREIAERAGVNYGLIHRHFGNREELVRRVMTSMAEDFREALADAIGSGRSPLAAVNEHPAYPRALARAALDGLDLTTLQNENPTIGALLAALSDTRSPAELQVEDRVAVAMISATVLGWAVFAPFLRAAVQLDDLDDARLGAHIEEAFTRLLSPQE